MVEESLSNLTIAETSNVFLERETKKLLLFDQDLKTLHIKYDLLTEESDFINKRIIGTSKKINDIADGVLLVKNISTTLKRLNRKTRNPSIKLNKDASPDLIKIMEMKLGHQKNLNCAYKHLEKKIKKTHVQLKSFQKQLNIATKHLKNEENYLLHFKNCICVLHDKKMRVFNEILKLENELNSIALICDEIPDQIIWCLKMMFDQKYLSMNRKLKFLKDTDSTLCNTIHEYNKTESLVLKMQMNVETLKNQILEANDYLEKDLVEEKKCVLSQCKKLELHLKVCTEVQNKCYIGEKLKVAQQYFQMFRKSFNESKHSLNNYQDKLFIQTLKIAIVKANIANTLLKRDNLEAQIASEMRERSLFA